jgi:glutathione S-transferase
VDRRTGDGYAPAMIKVWGRTNSINVQKVLWTLAELDLRFERSDAGMKFGVVDTPAYRAMNPNGLVPTIEDDGFVLWESNVIVRYLAEKYGRGTLCPSDLNERFSAERWMDWQQTALNQPIGPVFFNLIRVPPEKRDMAAVTKNRALAEGWLAILDEQLAGRDYINGERFTMADIPAGASVSRWYKLPIERQAHPRVESWLARLRTRPGFQAHIDQPLS